MMIKNLFKVLKNPFAGSRDKVTRSELVGMYLHQANHRGSYASEYFESRSRRNSRHSSRRDRE